MFDEGITLKLQQTVKTLLPKHLTDFRHLCSGYIWLLYSVEQQISGIQKQTPVISLLLFSARDFCHFYSQSRETLAVTLCKSHPTSSAITCLIKRPFVSEPQL